MQQPLQPSPDAHVNKVTTTILPHEDKVTVGANQDDSDRKMGQASIAQFQHKMSQ